MAAWYVAVGLDAEEQAREQVLVMVRACWPRPCVKRRCAPGRPAARLLPAQPGLRAGLPRSAPLMPASDGGQINGVERLLAAGRVDDELLQRVRATWVCPSKAPVIASACRKSWPKPSN